MPNRRELIAAGLAAVASAHTLLADERAEPVRVGVVGSGARGSDLIRALSTIQGVELAGVCDDYEPHLARGLNYAGPQAKAYSDFRKMLSELRPQAVVIAVPLVAHFEVASAALEAGCDVFCEKTMCYRLDEAQQLMRQVADSKRVFQVGLQRRANPIYQQAAAMVKAGLLGQISAIKCQWHRNNNWRRPVPVARSDSRWAALEQRLNWRLYRQSSGGLMAELGSHQLDVCNWLLGTTPKRVLASGGVDYWRDGRDVFDNVFCIYDYELPTPVNSAASGQDRASSYTVRVTYSSLCTNAYEGASELVLGTRGSLYLTSDKGLFYRERLPDDVGWAREPGRQDQDATVITSGKTLKLSNSPWAHRGEPIEIDRLQADDTRDELVSFIDHVRRADPRTICDVHEGLRDTATVLMANRAMEAREAVDYPEAG